jgi:hypothetical protein
VNKEVYELACSYKRCFTETTDGKAVLEDMKKGYCHHTTFHVEPVAMGFLEGHRDVVLRIDHLIDMASKPIEDILDEEDEHDGGRTNTGSIDTSGGHYL